MMLVLVAAGFSSDSRPPRGGGEISDSMFHSVFF